MASIQMDRSPREKNGTALVAFAATLLLPMVGIACLVAPEPVAGKLPYVLGAVMLFVGIADIVTDIINRPPDAGKISVGTDVVMIVLGAVSILNAAESVTFIAIMWGLLGLEKAAGELDESIGARHAGDRWIAPAITGGFELVLGTLLLIDPIASIGHHVLLLGLELIVYPFHVK